MIALLAQQIRRARQHALVASAVRPLAAYLLLLVVALVFSLGPYLGVDGALPNLLYLAGYHWWPGFDGIRAAARWGILALLAVSVLVAFAIQALALRWPRRAMATSALCSLLLVAEYVDAPIALAPLPDGGRPPAVYTWLAQQPGNDPVIELPLPRAWTFAENEKEYLRLYWSAQHWHPIFNGHSGYAPPLYLRALASSAEQQLEIARAIGIRYVILHRHDCLSDDEFVALRGVLVAAGEARVRLQYDDGKSNVYELLDRNTAFDPARCEPCSAAAASAFSNR